MFIEHLVLCYACLWDEKQESTSSGYEEGYIKQIFENFEDLILTVPEIRDTKKWKWMRKHVERGKRNGKVDHVYRGSRWRYPLCGGERSELLVMLAMLAALWQLCTRSLLGLY